MWRMVILGFLALSLSGCAGLYDTISKPPYSAAIEEATEQTAPLLVQGLKDQGVEVTPELEAALPKQLNIWAMQMLKWALKPEEDVLDGEE